MNLKERFQFLSGVDVNMDYFFYACLEAEKTHRIKADAVTQTWPDLEDALLEGIKGIHHQFDDLVAWYAANFPALNDSRVINYDRVNEVADGIVRLGVDLRTLVEKQTSKKFVIGLGESIDPEHNRLWKLFEEIVVDRFSAHASLYLQYLHWCFDLARTEDSPAVGDRPPVGRYAPSMRQRSANQSSNYSQSDRGGRSHSQNGSSRGNFHSKKNHNGNGGKDFQRRNQGKNFKRNHSQPREQDSSSQHQVQQASQAATDAAIMDVHHAVDILKGDVKMDKIALKPCNSFLRRLQHEEVKNLGFQSTSVGEGRDRTVVISRQGSEKASSPHEAGVLS